MDGVRRHLKAWPQGPHLCPSGGEDQRQLLPSYHRQLGGPLFGTKCSFVDEIKLNYILANTALHIYVRVAISGCVHYTVLSQ